MQVFTQKVLCFLGSKGEEGMFWPHFKAIFAKKYPPELQEYETVSFACAVSSV